MDLVEVLPAYIPLSEDDEPTLQSVKILLCKSIATISMSDQNMKTFVDQDDVIQRFINWTKPTDMSEALDDEIRMTGALCIGNVARSGTFEKIPHQLC